MSDEFRDSNDPLLSNMLAQVFVVRHQSFQEAMTLLLNDWLNVLDRFSCTKVSGNVLAIGAEAWAMREKNQGLIVPNQFPAHLKDRTIGIHSTCLVELIHDARRVKDNYWLPEERNLDNSTWSICMSDIPFQKTIVQTPFTTPFSVCQPFLSSRKIGHILRNNRCNDSLRLGYVNYLRQ